MEQGYDDDQLELVWINDLRSDSGISLSTEEIKAELHRRHLYNIEQPPPEKLYRVENPELQIIYVVGAIRGYPPLDLRGIADNVRGQRTEMSDAEVQRALDTLIERGRVRRGEMYHHDPEMLLHLVPGSKDQAGGQGQGPSQPASTTATLTPKKGDLVWVGSYGMRYQASKKYIPTRRYYTIATLMERLHRDCPKMGFMVVGPEGFPRGIAWGWVHDLTWSAQYNCWVHDNAGHR